MSQIPELPELQIVDTDSMQPHEDIEEGRSQRLIRALQTEGFLKNPPAVLRIEGETEQYVVLDGANRTMAFRKMGFPHMLVQIANEGRADADDEHDHHAGDERGRLGPPGAEDENHRRDEFEPGQQDRRGVDGPPRSEFVRGDGVGKACGSQTLPRPR